MEITAYQIHNVLKVYSRQLCRGKSIECQKGLGLISSIDQINISSEGRRQAVIEKVATNIIDRITSYGPQSDVEHEIVNQLENEFGKEESTEFVYNQIDVNNNKITSKLSVEGPDFILSRLEELTKEAVDKRMEKAR
ncbi:MAG: hypothetical protein PHP23_03860 [Desulfobacterales bacterium]|nr:hypothetical protein [Desulfobacterales bacterium]MDD4071966.1 hypothetical protein [Desulfobacterales bacterium]MDD4391730.1 hypothetical protein [Desulfobacterales bacterium]